MNYLIVEDFSGQAVPFIFPRRVDHGDMREQLPYGQVLSCGVLGTGARRPSSAPAATMNWASRRGPRRMRRLSPRPSGGGESRRPRRKPRRL